MRRKNNLAYQKKLGIIGSFTAAVAISVVACGVEKKPHYSDKTFGQGPTTAPNEGSGNGDSRDSAEETGNPTLLHQAFGGYFDLNSVRAIYYGLDPRNGQVSEGGVIDGIIATGLSFMVSEDSKETLEMIVNQQNTETNVVKQHVQTDGGDALMSFKGESESQSGTQTLEWALSNDETSGVVNTCPKTFVCLKRMIWRPTSGKTKTYCYRDHATKKPVTIPYSANSNFSREAYQAAIGDGLTSKPIDVITRPGDVSCDDPEAVTLDINQVVYQLSLGDMSAPAHPDFIRRAKVEPLNVDNEVVINYSLYDPSNRAPYTPKKGPFIDQLTRLNSKLRFFMNSSEHVIVKLETTVTSPFRFGTSSTAQFLKDAYGSSIGDSFAALTGQENNIEGIQINYAFEFCTHKSMVKQPLNHCTGQTSP